MSSSSIDQCRESITQDIQSSYINCDRMNRVALMMQDYIVATVPNWCRWTIVGRALMGVDDIRMQTVMIEPLPERWTGHKSCLHYSSLHGSYINIIRQLSLDDKIII
jgi:hypothetical protein